MPCLWAIRCITRANRLQNIKIREDTFSHEAITEDSGGLGMPRVRQTIFQRTPEERKAIE